MGGRGVGEPEVWNLLAHLELSEEDQWLLEDGRPGAGVTTGGSCSSTSAPVTPEEDGPCSPRKQGEEEVAARARFNYQRKLLAEFSRTNFPRVVLEALGEELGVNPRIFGASAAMAAILALMTAEKQESVVRMAFLKADSTGSYQFYGVWPEPADDEDAFLASAVPEDLPRQDAESGEASSGKKRKAGRPIQEDEPYRKELPNPWPWQAQLLKWLQEPPDERSIVWLYDPVGKMGKSQFAKHVITCHPGLRAILTGGKAADTYNQIAQMKNRGEGLPRVVLVDIPRDTNMQEFQYGPIEKVKDMLFYSGKYGSKDENNMVCGPCPHLVILCNHLPDRAKLSEDRWKVFRITAEREMILLP